MNVRDMIEEYNALNDPDLKYMILRREFEVGDIDNELTPLLNDLLLPILCREQDIQVIELLSYELLPNLLQRCIPLLSIAQLHDVNYIDSIVIDPLLSNHATSNFILVQTLRNVLKKLVDSNLAVKVNNDMISKFVLQMDSSNELFNANGVIYWETLNLLVKYYYNENTQRWRCTLPAWTFEDIMRKCVESALTSAMKETLVNVIKACDGADAMRLVSFVNAEVLVVISEAWYKFSEDVEARVFEDIVLARLSDGGLDIEEVLQYVIVLSNLHYYYDTAIISTEKNHEGEDVYQYSTGTKYLSEKSIRGVKRVLIDILQREVPVFNDQHATQLPVEDTKDVEMEYDPEQQAYLDELGSDGEDDDIFFEEDVISEGNDGGRDNSGTRAELLNVAVGILEKMPLTEQEYREVGPMLESPTPMRETREPGEGVLANFQQEIATHKDDLAALQALVNRISQYVAESPTEIYDWEATLLVPLLRPNKSFVNVIKVGNLKQSMDEGIELRLSVYDLLLRMPYSYATACLVIVEVVTNGLKDTVNNRDINEVAVKIVGRITAQYGAMMASLNSRWYHDCLLAQVERRLNKWGATREQRAVDKEAFTSAGGGQPAVTSQQSFEWEQYNRLMRHFAELF